MGVNLVEIVRIRISIAIFTAKEWQNLYFPAPILPKPYLHNIYLLYHS